MVFMLVVIEVVGCEELLCDAEADCEDEADSEDEAVSEDEAESDDEADCEEDCADELPSLWWVAWGGGVDSGGILARGGELL